jgi:peptidoglycan hydrolase-like protein with peptidoglycan-binding domain
MLRILFFVSVFNVLYYAFKAYPLTFIYEEEYNYSMNTLQKFLLLLTGAFLSVGVVSAEVVTDTVTDAVDCTAIRYSLKIGSKDSYTDGDVTRLQTYLSQANYLDADPTGYFGRATFKAVQAFQKDYSIAPQGNVGPYTRAKIKEVSCGNTATISPTNPAITPSSSSVGKENVLSGLSFKSKWNKTSSDGGSISVQLSGLPINNQIASYRFKVSCYGVALPRNGGELCGTSEKIRNLNISDFSYDFPFTLTNKVSAVVGIFVQLYALDANDNILGSATKSDYFYQQRPVISEVPLPVISSSKSLPASVVLTPIVPGPAYWVRPNDASSVCKYYANTSNYSVVDKRNASCSGSRCVSPTFVWVLGGTAIDEDRPSYLPEDGNLIRIQCSTNDQTPVPQPLPSLPAAVTSWKKSVFSTYNNQQDCSGDKYIGYSQKYAAWVGAQLCEDNTKYKLYMSDSENGTYYQIADTGGHGQDHCELVNQSFTIPNDDEITSGTCKTCSLGAMFDVQNEPVYVRSKIGENFTKAQSKYWGELTTKSYSCGVSITANQSQYTPPSDTSDISRPTIKVSLSDTVRSYSIGQMVSFNWVSDNLTAVLKDTQGSLWAGAYIENTSSGKRIFLGDAMSFREGDTKRLIPLSSEGVVTVPGEYKVIVYLYASGGNKAEGSSESFTVTETPTPVITSVSPTMGTAGSVVTIQGRSFSANDISKSNVVVNLISQYNQVQVLKVIEDSVVLCNSNNVCSVSVSIPNASTTEPGPYSISVKSSGKTSNSLPFTITPLSSIIENTISSFNAINAQGINLLQSLSGTTKAHASEGCFAIDTNLHRGYEGDTVSKLQMFLTKKGFLGEKVSGFFGDFTVDAVKAYQRSVGLKETGMVYDLTRQMIQSETCR